MHLIQKLMRSDLEQIAPKPDHATLGLPGILEIVRCEDGASVASPVRDREPEKWPVAIIVQESPRGGNRAGGAVKFDLQLFVRPAHGRQQVRVRFDSRVEFEGLHEKPQWIFCITDFRLIFSGSRPVLPRSVRPWLGRLRRVVWPGGLPGTRSGSRNGEG